MRNSNRKLKKINYIIHKKLKINNLIFNFFLQDLLFMNYNNSLKYSGLIPDTLMYSGNMYLKIANNIKIFRKLFFSHTSSLKTEYQSNNRYLRNVLIFSLKLYLGPLSDSILISRRITVHNFLFHRKKTNNATETLNYFYTDRKIDSNFLSLFYRFLLNIEMYNVSKIQRKQSNMDSIFSSSKLNFFWKFFSKEELDVLFEKKPLWHDLYIDLELVIYYGIFASVQNHFKLTNIGLNIFTVTWYYLFKNYFPHNIPIFKKIYIMLNLYFNMDAENLLSINKNQPNIENKNIKKLISCDFQYYNNTHIFFDEFAKFLFYRFAINNYLYFPIDSLRIKKKK